MLYIPTAYAATSQNSSPGPEGTIGLLGDRGRRVSY